MLNMFLVGGVVLAWKSEDASYLSSRQACPIQLTRTALPLISSSVLCPDSKGGGSADFLRISPCLSPAPRYIVAVAAFAVES